MKNFLVVLIAVIFFTACQSEYKSYLKNLSDAYAKIEESVTLDDYQEVDFPDMGNILTECSAEEKQDILKKQMDLHMLLLVKLYIINKASAQIDGYASLVTKDDMQILTQACMNNVASYLKDNLQKLITVAATGKTEVSKSDKTVLSGIEYLAVSKYLDGNTAVNKAIQDFVDKYSAEQ